jgi:autotransporter-associated beta strand protein
MHEQPMVRVVVCVVMLAVCRGAAAQDWALTGGGLWNEPANWNPMTVPDGVGAVANIADVISGGTLTVDSTFTFNAPVTLGSLNIEIGFAGPEIYFGPGTITMDNGGGADVSMLTRGTDFGDIQTDIVLMGDLIADWGSSNTPITGIISGNFGITKTGSPSTLRLAGANTYTGETVIETGSIYMLHAEALGNAAIGTRVEAGGALSVLIPGGPTINGEQVTLVDGGALRAISGVTWAEPITLMNSGNISSFFDNDIFTVSAQITGTGTFIRDSARSNSPGQESVLILTNNNNDYTGGTAIHSGVLSISDDGQLGMAGTGITFSGTGFSEGPAALLTTADITLTRNITMSKNGGLRAAAGTAGTYDNVVLTIGSANATGTVELLGGNPYSGGTDVTAGTLLVNNTAGSGTGTGPVTVRDGATLGGDGAITGAVTLESGATVAPGANAGTLSVGGITFDADSIFAVELGGLSAGEFDVLSVTGDASLAGTLDVSLLGVFEPMLGDDFTILEAATVDGTFAAVTGDPGPGLSYELAYSATDVVLSVIAAQVMIPGDADGDGDVDANDMRVISLNYGLATVNGAADGDHNGDGVVDLSDYDIAALNFGVGVPEGGAHPGAGELPAVPEPASLALLGAGGWLGLRRRRGAIGFVRAIPYEGNIK